MNTSKRVLCGCLVATLALWCAMPSVVKSDSTEPLSCGDMKGAAGGTCPSSESCPLGGTQDGRACQASCYDEYGHYDGSGIICKFKEER